MLVSTNCLFSFSLRSSWNDDFILNLRNLGIKLGDFDLFNPLVSRLAPCDTAESHGGACQTLKAISHKHEQSWHLSWRPEPSCRALNKSYVLSSCDLLPWEIRTAPLQHHQPPRRQCTGSWGWLQVSAHSFTICRMSNHCPRMLACWSACPQSSLLSVALLRTPYSNEPFHK